MKENSALNLKKNEKNVIIFVQKKKNEKTLELEILKKSTDNKLKTHIIMIIKKGF